MPYVHYFVRLRAAGGKGHRKEKCSFNQRLRVCIVFVCEFCCFGGVISGTTHCVFAAGFLFVLDLPEDLDLLEDLELPDVFVSWAAFAFAAS